MEVNRAEATKNGHNSSTLPACSNGDFGGDVICRVKWPVINDFWIVLFIGPFFAVNDKRNHGKIDIDCVVMPLVIANL